MTTATGHDWGLLGFEVSVESFVRYGSRVFHCKLAIANFKLQNEQPQSLTPKRQFAGTKKPARGGWAVPGQALLDT
jgi:hypothetical protein